MKQIEMTPELLLSPEDEDLRSKAKYCPERPDLRSKAPHSRYRPDGWEYKGRPIARVIAERMGLDMSEFIDHVDRDRNNNRRDNLRPATNRENQGNSKVRCDNQSGFKGVGYYARKRKWRARIRDHGTRRTIGYFNTPEEAAEAYAEAAQRIFGEFART